MRAVFSVDPGLQGTGVAFWKDSRQTVPSWVRVVKERKGEWINRSFVLAHEVSNLLNREVYSHCDFVCELMEMHGSARAQMMWKAGDFQRTLVFIGMLSESVRPNVDMVRLVKPSEWKGQLPKSIVERRLRREIGRDNCLRLQIESHAWDAVGIGMWHMGRF